MGLQRELNQHIQARIALVRNAKLQKHLRGKSETLDPAELDRLLGPAVIAVREPKPTVCRLCPRPVKGRGLCSKHFARFVRHGDPTVERKQAGVSCRECGGPYHAAGLCSVHYSRAYRAGRVGRAAP